MSSQRPRRAGQPQGQWALGATEPLNHNEAVKQEDGGLNVRRRVEERYAAEGFATPDVFVVAPSDGAHRAD